MEVLTAFTDGACSRNGKKDAVAGVGVFFPQMQHLNISQRLNLCAEGPQTNQRAELMAIIAAFEVTCELNQPLKIVTDSKYCHDILTKWIHGWMVRNALTGEQKANWDLVSRLFVAQKTRNFEVVLVRGHQRISPHMSQAERELAEGNHRADQLATQSIA